MVGASLLPGISLEGGCSAGLLPVIGGSSLTQVQTVRSFEFGPTANSVLGDLIYCIFCMQLYV